LPANNLEHHVHETAAAERRQTSRQACIGTWAGLRRRIPVRLLRWGVIHRLLRRRRVAVVGGTRPVRPGVLRVARRRRLPRPRWDTHGSSGHDPVALGWLLRILVVEIAHPESGRERPRRGSIHRPGPLARTDVPQGQQTILLSPTMWWDPTRGKFGKKLPRRRYWRAPEREERRKRRTPDQRIGPLFFTPYTATFPSVWCEYVE
jgi:hypothetical protein